MDIEDRYNDNSQLTEREKTVLVDLLDYLTDKGLLTKPETDHYRFTPKDKPTAGKTYTKEEKEFREEYDKFRIIVVLYVDLYITYSGDTSLLILSKSRNSIFYELRYSFEESITLIMGSSLSDIFSELYKKRWTDIYSSLDRGGLIKIEELEMQTKDIKLANYLILQNFILLIKNIVKFWISEYNMEFLDLRSLTLKELREIGIGRGSDVDIINLLIKSHAESEPQLTVKRQLLIIENPPESLADSVTSLAPNFNKLILIIKDAITDDLIEKTKRQLTQPFTSVKVRELTSMSTMKIPDECMLYDVIESTLLWISPHSGERLYNYKGKALLQSEEYEEAEPFFDRALQINPNYADALNNKGICVLRLRKPEEAEPFFDRALQIDPRPAAYNYKGSVYLQLQKFEEAVSSYNKALEIDPNYADAMNNKGKALLRLGRPEDAEPFFDKALEIDPKNKNAYNNKGNIYRDSKGDDWWQAEKYYNQALDIDPNFTAAWFNKGKFLLKRGMNKEALDCFIKILEIVPKSRGAKELQLKAKDEVEKLRSKIGDLKTEMVSQITEENVLSVCVVVMKKLQQETEMDETKSINWDRLYTDALESNIGLGYESSNLILKNRVFQELRHQEYIRDGNQAGEIRITHEGKHAYY